MKESARRGEGAPRYGLYALDQRAAEAVTTRFWATTALADNGTRRNVLLSRDLNDTPEAATTQLLLGPRDRRSAPAASTNPTKATTTGC